LLYIIMRHPIPNKLLASLFFFSIILSFGPISALSDTSDTLDNRGNDFIIAFLPNDLIGDSPTVELHLTAEASTEVTIHYPVNSPTFEESVDVNPGEITVVELPASAAQGWPKEEVANNAVRLFAEKDFIAYMANRKQFSSDASVALPVESLGTQYIVMTYDPLIFLGFFTPSHFVVTAVEDDTTVTITPSVDTEEGHLAGEPFEVSLNRGEGYMVRQAESEWNGGLTGSQVSADGPIGVTNGNDCTFVPPETPWCDTIFEVAQPVHTWGNEIPVVNLPNRPSGSVYRILASEDNTTLKKNGTEIGVLNKGQFYETDSLPGAHLFSANKPIFVVQFMTGSVSPGAILGDPSMGNMVPAEQYLEGYTFSTVGGDQFDQHWLTIIAQNDDVGAVELNGAPIDAGEFSSISNTTLSYARLMLEQGTHTTSSTLPHGITVQGYASEDSYLYPGGVQLAIINPSADMVPLCESFDLSPLQFELDNLAYQQRALVRRITRAFVRRSQGSGQEFRARRTRRNLREQANELYEQNWINAWSMPSTILQCEQSPLCVEASTATSMAAYNENVHELFRLTRVTNRRMRRFISSRAPVLMRRSRTLRDAALQSSEAMPLTYDTCEVEPNLNAL